MHSFAVHAFGPPSSELLDPPLSGRVSGGNTNGGGPPSSPPLDEGKEDAPSPGIASSGAALESSRVVGFPAPLPLPPPEVEHVAQASSPGASGSVPPEGLPAASGDDDDAEAGGLPLVAQPAAAIARSIPNSPIRTVAAPFFCVARITGGKADGAGGFGVSPACPLSCHFRPPGGLH